jgi:hypothetical protein
MERNYLRQANHLDRWINVSTYVRPDDLLPAVAYLQAVLAGAGTPTGRTAEKLCGAPHRDGGQAMTSWSSPIRVVHAQFPKASDVCLLGEFNNWSTTATPMRRVGAGTWEARLEASVRLGNVCFFVYDTGQRIGRLVHGSPVDVEWHNA